MFYRLHYFKKGDGLCGSDLDNRNQVDTINLTFVSSLSDLQKFTLPFSGTFKGNYAVLTMSNGDRYYIKEDIFASVSTAIQMMALIPKAVTCESKCEKCGGELYYDGTNHYNVCVDCKKNSIICQDSFSSPTKMS